VFVCEPLKNGLADEFRTVVGSQVGRGAVLGDQAPEGLDCTLGTDRACDINLEAFAGKFIDHGPALELLRIGAGIEGEILGPDMVGSPWC